MINYLKKENFPFFFGLILTLKRKLRLFLAFIFFLGLIYLILPGPHSVADFPPLPRSARSSLDGDTWQNPNIVAYYADFRRYFITWFYEKNFTKMYLFGFIIPPVRINHPPEYAYQYIRDQQESTFLEEYVYPLRESIFVNGYEPMIEDEMNKKVHSFVGDHIYFQEVPYDSKTTLRFYTSNVVIRLLIYFGCWLSAFAMYKILIQELKGQKDG